MSLYGALRPVLFSLPPERIHDLGKTALRATQNSALARGALRRLYRVSDPRLNVEAFGVEFPSPVGIAAGFDKNGEVMQSVADLGFGFTEVGTVTPAPQRGNPRPRLFRLPEDSGLINRLAFNNEGADRVRERFDRAGLPDIPVAVNIGKMNDSDREDAIEDYATVFRTLYRYPDYFVLNVSCPNTPEGYDEQDPDHIRSLLGALAEENADDKPVLVKVGPDSDRESLADLVDICRDFDVDGYVATNTTTDHGGLASADREEWGGVSGRPLREHATRTVRTLAELSDRPIVGVGGVDSAESAYEKIRAGASLVQLYTGFVYNGPSTAKQINDGLLDLLEADGFESVEEAVGVDVERTTVH